MKNKIIAALKTAYATLGLSDEAFDGVASLLEKTVTEEANIATAVSGDEVKALLKTIQGNVDSWKNKYHDKNKELDEYKKAHPEQKQDPKEPPKEDDQIPEWAKGILARFNKEDEERKLKEAKAKVVESAKTAGCTDERILKLTEKLFTSKEGESDEDAAARFKAEYDSNAKEYFGGGQAPFHSGNLPGPDDANVVAGRKAWVEQHLKDLGDKNKIQK